MQAAAPDGNREDGILFPPAQRAVIGRWPIESSPFEQTGRHAGRLAQRKAEQVLEHQAGLDRRIGDDLRTVWFAAFDRKPGHILIKLEQ
ncbi:hypothetical protein JHS3_17140 [Jeongeupia sp. HS-3]|nr:hypothetical protein JHS3_17140 [Jeongeupia sp. HS-3]